MKKFLRKLFCTKSLANHYQISPSNERLEYLAEEISHSLSPSLVSIAAGINSIVEFLPILIEGYKAAKAANLSIGDIHPQHLVIIDNILSNTSKEANNALTSLRILSTNLKPVNNNNIVQDSYSIYECIHNAIKIYPYKNKAQRDMSIKLDNLRDFTFYGDKSLIETILLNILREAILRIEKSGIGFIEFFSGKNQNLNIITIKYCPFESMNQSEIVIAKRQAEVSALTQNFWYIFCLQAMQQMSGYLECNLINNEFIEYKLSFNKQ